MQTHVPCQPAHTLDHMINMTAHLDVEETVLLHLRCFFFAFSILYAKYWRGTGSRRDCHLAPKHQTQMWSTAQKVTQSHSLIESQRKRKTWPARVLAKKSLLKNKTSRRRCVYNTNYCGQSTGNALGIKSLAKNALNTCVPAFCLKWSFNGHIKR